jgi:hypothetical protein
VSRNRSLVKLSGGQAFCSQNGCHPVHHIKSQFFAGCNSELVSSFPRLKYKLEFTDQVSPDFSKNFQSAGGLKLMNFRAFSPPECIIHFFFGVVFQVQFPPNFNFHPTSDRSLLDCTHLSLGYYRFLRMF